MLINLTPHALTLLGAQGQTVYLPASGQVARVSEIREALEEIEALPVASVQLGEVEGLPEPQDGVVYVVSALVAGALGGRRSDVVSPGAPVRDAHGSIIGARGLTRRV